MRHYFAALELDPVLCFANRFWVVVLLTLTPAAVHMNGVQL